jgi:hypothetical protein
LADGLLGRDGQREITIGAGVQGIINETVTGHLTHRRQHPFISDTAGHQLLLYHLGAAGGKSIIHC